MHHAKIDKLACQSSFVHSLDARTKLISVILFSAFTISVPYTSLSILACYAVGPFIILVSGKVPFRFVLKQLLIVSPFIAVLAISNVYFDRNPVVVSFGPFALQTTMGVMRCLVIFVKFIITMSALIGLVATTRFGDLLEAMANLSVPRVLVMQISFVYRFIFLMIDRGHHILMARNARRIERMGLKREIATAAAMGGSLFLGSIDTAGKVNMSMLARGFDGTFHGREKTTFKGPDAVFFGITVVYIGLLIIIGKAL